MLFLGLAHIFFKTYVSYNEGKIYWFMGIKGGSYDF